MTSATLAISGTTTGGGWMIVLVITGACAITGEWIKLGLAATQAKRTDKTICEYMKKKLCFRFAFC